ncbi:ubiquitin carboxyl-terminal hydrolase faf-x-related [Anaeramoeba flamelloides]|uniref:Ubiquitin carboxyl-terminal hydrolase faf-x-related n=1 Tax=Anaeramoeba flamelloides TaxID=1746091 RepID=A0AAV8AAA5_9EUKA|nr:ubiquitin carboxyl-terminal hydrolase faf-x-related [Anaeramoeba flamelloides]
MSSNYTQHFKKILGLIKKKKQITEYLQDLVEAVDQILNGSMKSKQENWMIKNIFFVSVKTLWLRSDFNSEDAPLVNHYFQKCLILVALKIEGEKNNLLNVFNRIFWKPSKTGFYRKYFPEESNKIKEIQEQGSDEDEQEQEQMEIEDQKSQYEIEIKVIEDPFQKPEIKKKEKEKEKKEKENEKEEKNLEFSVRKYTKQFVSQLLNKCYGTFEKNLLSQVEFPKDLGLCGVVDFEKHPKMTYLKQNIEFFAKIGGFRKLLHYFVTTKHTIDGIKTFKILRPILRVSKYFQMGFFEQIIPITNKLFDRLLLMKYETMKQESHKDIDDLIEIAVGFKTKHDLTLAKIEIEKFKLELDYKYFFSPNLEMRVSAMNHLISIIQNLENSNNSQNTNNSYSHQYIYSRATQTIKYSYYNNKVLVNWLNESKLLFDCFNVSIHQQIVQRTPKLLKFIGKNGGMSKKLLETIFSKSEGVNSSFSELIFEIISNISSSLDLSLIKYIFQDKLLIIKNWDSPKIKFLKEFTTFTLEKFIEPFNFMFGLILNKRLPYKIRIMIRDSMKSVFGSDNFNAEMKETTLNKLLTQLSDDKISSIFLLPLFESLISAYSKYKTSSDTVTQQTITDSLMEERNFILLLLDDLLLYKKNVRQVIDNNNLNLKASPLSTKNTEITMTATVTEWKDYIFLENLPYLERIEFYLDFIKNFLKFSKNAFLSIESVKKLWEIHVENPIIPEERGRFLEWIRSTDTKFAVDILLFEKIQTIKDESFTAISFNFFKHFGYYSNIKHKNIKGKKDTFIVKNENLTEILGYEKLFLIILKVKDEAVLDLAINFLFQFQNFNTTIFMKCGAEKRKEFIEKCLNFLVEYKDNDNIILRILSLLMRYIAFIEEDIAPNQFKFEKHSNTTQKYPINLICHNYVGQKIGYGYQKFEIEVDAHDQVSMIKTKISEEIKKNVDEFRITSSVNYHLEQSQTSILSQVGIVDGVKINIFKPVTWINVTSSTSSSSNYNKLSTNKKIKKMKNKLIPSYILSNYFDKIFDLLESKTNNLKITTQVWELLLLMPSNAEILNNFLNLFHKKIENDKVELMEIEELSWDDHLNSHSLFKLVYNIQLISNLVKKSQEENAEISYINWIKNFINFNGVNHLIRILINVFNNNDNRPIKKQALSIILNLIGNLSIIEEEIKKDNKNEKMKIENENDNKENKNENDNKETEDDENKENKDKKKKKEKTIIKIKFNPKVKIEKEFNNNFINILLEIISNTCIDLDSENLQENAIIIHNAFSLIIAYNEYEKKENNNRGIEFLLKYSDIKNWLKKTLIDSMFTQISKIVFESLYRLCKNDIMYNEESLGFLLLKLSIELFNELENHLINFKKQENKNEKMKIENENENENENKSESENENENENENNLITEEEEYGNFFNLFSKLIKLYSKMEIKNENFNFEIIYDKIINIIKKRPVIESDVEGFEKCDETLIGLFNIAIFLLKNNNKLKLKNNQTNFINYLFLDCLFKIPQDNKSESTNKLPKCKSKKSILKVYQLLIELIADCKKNSETLANLINNFQSNVQPPRSWNYRPTFYGIKTTKKYLGLKNLGATCYLNSFLQQLFNTPEFRKGLLSIENYDEKKDNENEQENEDNKSNTQIQKQDKKKDDNFLPHLQSIFSELWKSNRWAVSTKPFCNRFLDWDGNPINTFVQMDAYEFLNRIFDKVEEKIKSTKQNNFIEKTFVGKFASQIIGIKEPHFSERLENFYSISLDIIKKKNVYESLDHYIEGDMLTGDNKYYSDLLGKKVDALKRTCIHTLPPYLILHLKRFEFDMNTMQRYKVNDHFEFPMELDLFNYTKEGIYQREKERQKENNAKTSINDFQEKYVCPNKCYKYELCGILIHLGSTRSGHYYSFIKERETRKDIKPKNPKWFKFDDSTVTEFDIKNIPQECFGASSKDRSIGNNDISNTQNKYGYSVGDKRYSAYMLFYQRIDIKNQEMPEFKPSKYGEQILNEKLKENMNYIIQKKVFHSNYYNFISNFFKYNYLNTKQLIEKENNNNNNNNENENKNNGDQNDKLILNVLLQFYFKILLYSKDKTINLKEWIDYLETILRNKNNLILLLNELIDNNNTALFENFFFNSGELNSHLIKILIKSFPKLITAEVNSGLIKKDLNQLITIMNNYTEQNVSNEKEPVKDKKKFKNYSRWYDDIFNNTILNNEKTQWNSLIIKFVIKLLTYFIDITRYWKKNFDYLKLLSELIVIHPLLTKFFIKLNFMSLLIDFNLGNKTPIKAFIKTHTLSKKNMDKFAPEQKISNTSIKLLLKAMINDQNNELGLHDFDKYMLLETAYIPLNIVQSNRSNDTLKVINYILKLLPDKLDQMVDILIKLVDDAQFWGLQFVFDSFNIIFDKLDLKQITIGNNKQQQIRELTEKQDQKLKDITQRIMEMIIRNARYPKATKNGIENFRILIENNNFLTTYILQLKEQWIERFLLLTMKEEIKMEAQLLIKVLINNLIANSKYHEMYAKLLLDLFTYLLSLLPWITNRLYGKLEIKKDTLSESSEEDNDNQDDDDDDDDNDDNVYNHANNYSMQYHRNFYKNKNKNSKKKKISYYKDEFYLLIHYFKILSSFIPTKENEILEKKIIEIIEANYENLFNFYQKIQSYQIANDLNKKEFLLFWYKWFNLNDNLINFIILDKERSLIIKNFYFVNDTKKHLVNVYNKETIPTFVKILKFYSQKSNDFLVLMKNSKRLKKLLINLLLNSNEIDSGYNNELLSFINIINVDNNEKEENEKEEIEKEENEKEEIKKEEIEKEENEKEKIEIEDNEKEDNFKHQCLKIILNKKLLKSKNFILINPIHFVKLLNLFIIQNDDINYFIQNNGLNILSNFLINLIENFLENNVIDSTFEIELGIFENLNKGLILLLKLIPELKTIENKSLIIDQWSNKVKLFPLLLRLMESFNSLKEVNELLEMISKNSLLCLTYLTDKVINILPSIISILAKWDYSIYSNNKSQENYTFPYYFQYEEYHNFLINLFRICINNKEKIKLLKSIIHLLSCELSFTIKKRQYHLKYIDYLTQISQIMNSLVKIIKYQNNTFIDYYLFITKKSEYLEIPLINDFILLLNKDITLNLHRNQRNLFIANAFDIFNNLIDIDSLMQNQDFFKILLFKLNLFEQSIEVNKFWKNHFISVFPQILQTLKNLKESKNEEIIKIVDSLIEKLLIKINSEKEEEENDSDEDDDSDDGDDSDDDNDDDDDDDDDDDYDDDLNDSGDEDKIDEKYFNYNSSDLSYSSDSDIVFNSSGNNFNSNDINSDN